MEPLIETKKSSNGEHEERKKYMNNDDVRRQIDDDDDDDNDDENCTLFKIDEGNAKVLRSYLSPIFCIDFIISKRPTLFFFKRKKRQFHAKYACIGKSG